MEPILLLKILMSKLEIWLYKNWKNTYYYNGNKYFIISNKAKKIFSSPEGKFISSNKEDINNFLENCKKNFQEWIYKRKDWSDGDIEVVVYFEDWLFIEQYAVWPELYEDTVDLSDKKDYTLITADPLVVQAQIEKNKKSVSEEIIRVIDTFLSTWDIEDKDLEAFVYEPRGFKRKDDKLIIYWAEDMSIIDLIKKEEILYLE